MTDPAWERDFTLESIARRLVRWNSPVPADRIERQYDAEYAVLSRRMRIMYIPGLPLIRSNLPWHVQKRRFGIWRTQGLYGSRDGMPTRDIAEWFFSLCLRVDARDAAFEALRRH